jgi:hypothetical protein
MKISKEGLKNLKHHEANLSKALTTQNTEEILKTCRETVNDATKYGYLVVEATKEETPKDPFDVSNDEIWDLMPQEIKDSFKYPENPKEPYKEKIEDSISSWVKKTGKKLLDWVKTLIESFKKELNQVGKLLTKPLNPKDIAIPAALLVATMAINPNGSLRATELLTKDLTSLQSYYNDPYHGQKTIYRAGKEYVNTFKSEVIPQIKQEISPLME